MAPYSECFRRCHSTRYFRNRYCDLHIQSVSEDVTVPGILGIVIVTSIFRVFQKIIIGPYAKMSQYQVF